MIMHHVGLMAIVDSEVEHDENLEVIEEAKVAHFRCLSFNIETMCELFAEISDENTYSRLCLQV